MYIVLLFACVRMFEPARVNCVRLLPRRSPRAIFTGNGCARGNGSDRVYVDLFIRVAPRVGHGNRKRVYIFYY